MEKDKKLVPYNIVDGGNGGRVGRGARRENSPAAPPSQVSALILQKMEGNRRKLPSGEDVTQAVITVPAYFKRRPAPGNERRRQDRGPRGAAHHQRTDGRGARLRSRQEATARRSRSMTSAAGTFDITILEIDGRPLRGEIDQRRHVPPAAKTSTCGSSTTSPRSSRKSMAST